MRQFFIKIFILGLLGFYVNSCQTEFSVNGPYERIPIVFGLLNSNDTVQFVKITRTFLGDGNNNDYAQIPDSNYFDVVDAKIVEMNGHQETGREWALHDTIIPNKEEGLFYGPEQKVYVFYAGDLDETKTYKLVADLDEGDYQIEATTNMTSGFYYKSQYSQTGFTLGFAYSYSTQNNEYPNQRITYQEALNGKLYQTSLVFKWKETYLDGTSQNFEAQLDAIPYEQDNPDNPINTDGLGKTTPTFSGEDFYKFIQEQIDPDVNVDKREFIGIDFVTGIANEEVATYMEISKPQSTIVETKPTYTNIESSSEKAYGIFGCRQYVKVENLQLNANSILELCSGQFTYDLQFCSTMAEHIGESFYCQ